MNTTFSIDWIRATTKDYSVASVIKQYTYDVSPDDWRSFKPPGAYDQGMHHPFGHSIMWSTVRDDMGVNIQFDGRACAELHDRGVDMLQVVRDLSEDGFKFTRLDLATDIFGLKIDIVGLLECEHKGSANNDPVLIQKGKNARGGATLYVGGRQSEKYLRVYDKAKERGMMDTLWTRIELELKSKTATKIAAKFVHMTYEEIAKMTQGMVKGIYDPDDENFQSALQVDALRVGSTKNESHSTYDWLMSSVAKTLAKVIIELPHRDVMTTFEKEVMKHIREMASQNVSRSNDETVV